MRNSSSKLRRRSCVFIKMTNVLTKKTQKPRGHYIFIIAIININDQIRKLTFTSFLINNRDVKNQKNLILINIPNNNQNLYNMYIMKKMIWPLRKEHLMSKIKASLPLLNSQCFKIMKFIHGRED